MRSGLDRNGNGNLGDGAVAEGLQRLSLADDAASPAGLDTSDQDADTAGFPDDSDLPADGFPAGRRYGMCRS